MGVDLNEDAAHQRALRLNSEVETVRMYNEAQAEIWDLNSTQGDKFSMDLGVSTVLNQPSLTKYCELLPVVNDSLAAQKQLLIGCEAIDSRSNHLNDHKKEVTKRKNDSWTNLVTTGVAFIVVLTTGLVDAPPDTSTIITNLSPIVLNLLLSLRALYLAHDDKKLLLKKETQLTQEYLKQRWRMKKYVIRINQFEEGKKKNKMNKLRETESTLLQIDNDEATRNADHEEASIPENRYFSW